MFQYAKHPVGIAYFLALTTGTAVAEYYWWTIIASDTSITPDEQIAAGLISCFVTSVMMIVMGTLLYTAIVELSLWKQRKVLGDEISKLHAGTIMAKNAITEAVRLEHIVKADKNNTGLYSQIAPLYVVMVSNTTEKSGYLCKDSSLTKDDYFELTTVSRETLESIAKVISDKMNEKGCTLPKRT